MEGILAYYGCSPLEMEQAFSSEKMVAVELELTMLHGDIKGKTGASSTQKHRNFAHIFGLKLQKKAIQKENNQYGTEMEKEAAAWISQRI